MSINTAATTPDAAPPAAQQAVNGYDLASHYLVTFQGKNPQQLQELVAQLVQNYGPEAVFKAAQNLAVMTEGIRWQAYGAMAVVQRQPVPPHPYAQPNPFPVPNFTGAAETVAAYSQANGPTT